MNELDRLHLTILYAGLVAIRNAAQRGDLAWCKAESEHLHEVPSLIGETNVRRHVYHATAVRRAYLDWVARDGGEDVREFVDTWYSLAWRQMDRLLGIEQAGPS